MSDVNLKFNKPELNVTIDRERRVSVIGANVTAFLSGQRFGYS
jgi:HAE1 family hydrophobic/amphiphilic exporter-1/multidrug efflux pump